MARSTRRRDPAPPHAAAALVLDSEGLSRSAAGDVRAVAWIARARELRLPLVVNAVTLTETVRGAPRDAAVHRLTRNARVDAVDAGFAVEAGRLLGATGRADTVDALVATTAVRLNQPVTILTSDPDDLRALTTGHPLVEVVAI
ncbi:MAG: PIN domain-containing protein [Sporichthyaceae bacterium]